VSDALGPVLLAHGSTDVGQRSHNEDAFVIAGHHGLIVVADGVGGHQAGEIASQITCQTLAESDPEVEPLAAAIERAHHAVLAAAENGQGRAGMASTVVAVRFRGVAFELVWVGDSRAYLWDGKLHLLTRDHSLVEALLQRGEISFAEARTHPRRNVIAQAVGLASAETLSPGSNSGALAPGQRLLLCSDGLNDVLDSGEIAALLTAEPDTEQCAQRLMEAARAAGGRDNITVVVAEVTADDADEVVPDAVAPAQVVWTFDPDTGAYSGLPEVEASAEPRVRKIAPRQVADAVAADQTQMLSSGDMAAIRPVPQASRSASPRISLVRVLAVSVVASALLVFFILLTMQ